MGMLTWKWFYAIISCLTEGLIKYVVLPWNLAQVHPNRPFSIPFRVAYQSGNSEMITVCLIPNICTTCKKEHSCTTFGLPSLSVTSEKNGHCVNMFHSKIPLSFLFALYRPFVFMIWGKVLIIDLDQRSCTSSKVLTKGTVCHFFCIAITSPGSLKLLKSLLNDHNREWNTIWRDSGRNGHRLGYV